MPGARKTAQAHAVAEAMILEQYNRLFRHSLEDKECRLFEITTARAPDTTRTASCAGVCNCGCADGNDIGRQY